MSFLPALLLFAAPPLPNGVYPVLREAPAEAEAHVSGRPHIVLRYTQKDSEADQNQPPRFVALDPASPVPLHLAAPPAEAPRDARGWAAISVTLVPEQVKPLADFTRAHLGGSVAIVLDNEIVTIHTVRAVIEDGRFVISRCFDNACQALRSKLTTAPLGVIPLQLGENYRLGLTARINGAEYACSLDSAGGDRIYLDKSKALAAGIQPTSEERSGGPQSASITADSRARVSLALGGLSLDNQLLVMQNRPQPGYQCVIGLGVLQQYVIEIGYQPAELRVFDPARYQPAANALAASFELDGGNPFVQVTLHPPQGEPVTARLAVDTGGGRPAGYLTKSFLDRHNLMARFASAVPDFWSGFAEGRPRVLAARFAKIQLGDVEIARPIFFLWQTRGFGGATEPDGLLCPDFLRRFHLAFDYPRRRLLLAPGPQFAAEMPFDASGTLLYRQGQEPYRVFKVIEGSPAAEAGLREGDSVLEMDGRPAANLSQRLVNEILETPGREIALRVQRGAETFNLKFHLRRLL